MPLLTIETNVESSKIPSDLSDELGQIVAKHLGKPSSYVAVMIIPDRNLVFGGSKDPSAVCSLKSIGGIDRDSNKKASKLIQEALEKSLGISTSRQYLLFEDLKGENVGYKTGTFA